MLVVVCRFLLFVVCFWRLLFLFCLTVRFRRSLFCGVLFNVCCIFAYCFMCHVGWMLLVVCCCLRVWFVYCVLFVVRSSVFVVGYGALLFVVYCCGRFVVVCCLLLFVVRCLSCSACCMLFVSFLFVVCRVSCVVLRLPFVVVC